MQLQNIGCIFTQNSNNILQTKKISKRNFLALNFQKYGGNLI